MVFVQGGVRLLFADLDFQLQTMQCAIDCSYNELAAIRKHYSSITPPTQMIMQVQDVKKVKQ